LIRNLDVENFSMNYQGIIIGLASFLIIGVFHPIVVKAEYYLGFGIWPVFLVVGIGSLVASLFVDGSMLSAIVGVFGFACLWSIRELNEQVERVQKGWFPSNPKR
jgi:uncharacterized membrane protein YuzA (DUF378 family)